MKGTELHRRRLAIAGLAVLLAAIPSPRPHVRASALALHVGDIAPHRIDSAADLGAVGVKLLVAWTADQLR